MVIKGDNFSSSPLTRTFTKDQFISRVSHMKYFLSVIRSFVCNTKRPSVKQSMKWQVSSNFSDLG